MIHRIARVSLVILSACIGFVAYGFQDLAALVPFAACVGTIVLLACIVYNME